MPTIAMQAKFVANYKHPHTAEDLKEYTVMLELCILRKTVSLISQYQRSQQTLLIYYFSLGNILMAMSYSIGGAPFLLELMLHSSSRQFQCDIRNAGEKVGEFPPAMSACLLLSRAGKAAGEVGERGGKRMKLGARIGIN